MRDRRLGMARSPRAPGRVAFAAAGLLVLVLAACGAGNASPPPGASPDASFAWPSGVPRLRDMLPEEVEGIPIDPGTEPIEMGKYTWTSYERFLTPDDKTVAFGRGVETIWDPDLGIIILGPEETGEQVGQLILNVAAQPFVVDDETYGEMLDSLAADDPVVSEVVRESNYTAFKLVGATLSWTLKRVGTLDRGEAELFELSEKGGLILVSERGPNYLKGLVSVHLERAAVLIGGAELDDRKANLGLEGRFIAVEP